MPRGGRKQHQRGGFLGGHAHYMQPKPFTKRARENSSEIEDLEDDPDTIVDALVGALNDPEIMSKFVECICSSKALVNSLVGHLVPSLQDTLKSVLDPLKTSIENLTEQLKRSDQRCVELELKNDDLEQYTRRQNLRISGITENKDENTDSLVVDFVKNTMKIDLDTRDIDRSHRVGRPNSKNNRDIIIRFTSWKARQRIIKAKKSVFEHNRHHRTSYFVSEDLTKNRSAMAYHARQLKKTHVIKDTWTADGKIFIKHQNDKISVCTRLSDLPQMQVSPDASFNRKTYASAAKEPMGHSA